MQDSDCQSLSVLVDNLVLFSYTQTLEICFFFLNLVSDVKFTFQVGKGTALSSREKVFLPQIGLRECGKSQNSKTTKLHFRNTSLSEHFSKKVDFHVFVGMLEGFGFLKPTL